jgi:hypothetical protein
VRKPRARSATARLRWRLMRPASTTGHRGNLDQVEHREPPTGPCVASVDGRPEVPRGGLQLSVEDSRSATRAPIDRACRRARAISMGPTSSAAGRQACLRAVHADGVDTSLSQRISRS